MARRLQLAAVAGQAAAEDFATTADTARADLLRADLSEEAGPFHDMLVALLLGRSYSFGRLPEGTVEDWLWFRLHGVLSAGCEGSRSSEFEQHLEALQQQARSVPPSHYDPGPGGSPPAASVVPGLQTSRAQVADGRTVSGSASAAAGLGLGQTLNFVKVLLLTLQLGRAIQQLRSQDRSLRGPALHIAIVLHRAGALRGVDGDGRDGDPHQVPSMASLVCDYACRFRACDQLQYFRLLDPADRAQALQRLLLRGGFGANDELLGGIDGNGRHRPGLLERALQATPSSDRAEFVELCAGAGRQALEQGQYREALRLLHLGRCYGDVLQVLCRCLRLPIWHDAAASVTGEVAALATDIQRFYMIYERNLDRYALSSRAWSVARKLYAIRTFHSLCERGQCEAALDLFDREQLLPFGGPGADRSSDSEVQEVDELFAEYPRLVANYVCILRHVASRSASVSAGSLSARLRQLQMFLAVHAHRLVLDGETTASLAGLALG